MGRRTRKNRSPGDRDPSRPVKRAVAGQTPRGDGNHPGRKRQMLDLLKVLGVCCLLLVTVLAVFGQTVRHEFIVCDDNAYIYENAHVRDGLTWDSVRWALTTGYAGNWHPLTWLSNMLDVQCYGIHPGNEPWKGPEAGGHHLTNVLLHAASAIVLFLVLRQMTGAFWCSAVVAGMFALHPLRAESVAWAAERKDVLGAVLDADDVRLRLVRPAARRRPLPGGRGPVRPGTDGQADAGDVALRAAAAGFLAAGAMAAEKDFSQTDGDGGSCRSGAYNNQLAFPTTASVPLTPAFSIPADRVVAGGEAAAVGLVDRRERDRRAGARQRRRHEHDRSGAAWAVALPTRLVSYVAYLWKTVWPVNLAIFYPHPAVMGAESVSRMMWQAVLAAIVLAAITLLVLWNVRRRPYLAVGWFWYLGTLIPVIGLVQFGAHAMADRFTYLPTIGIYVMVVWGAAELAAHWARLRVALATAAGLLLATWAGLTAVQVAHWQNSFTVFEHAIQVTDNNYFAYNHLGMAYQVAGDFEKAGAEYAEAVRAGPSYDSANGNLGVYYLRHDQNREGPPISPKCSSRQPVL